MPKRPKKLSRDQIGRRRVKTTAVETHPVPGPPGRSGVRRRARRKQRRLDNFSSPELQLIYWGVKDLKTTDTKRREVLIRKLIRLGVQVDNPGFTVGSNYVEPVASDPDDYPES